MTTKYTLKMTAEELQEMINEGLRNSIQEIAQIKNQELVIKNEILTREQVLDMLKIGPTTLWKMMTSGKLPYKKAGKRVLFSKNDVMNVITNLNNSWRQYE